MSYDVWNGKSAEILRLLASVLWLQIMVVLIVEDRLLISGKSWE